MTRVLVTEESLYDIADEIRAKNGESQTYLPSEMPAAIRRIQTGDGVQSVHEAYVVGEFEYEAGWLSYTDGGPSFAPEREVLYVIADGDHLNEVYRWDGSAYVPVSKIPDDALDDESTNAVQNAVVYAALQLKADATDLPETATTSTEGVSKPDGTSITISDGTLSVGTVPTTALSGTISSANLPSYVDDVVEGYLYQGAFYEESTHTTSIAGETGKIYVDLTDDSTYRWSGSAYVSISNPIDFATESEARAGTDNTKAMTPLRTAQAIEAVSDALGDLAADVVDVADSIPALATTSAAGTVRPDGTTITVSDGTISATQYQLPTMSPTTKGGAKLGHGLTVEDGALGIGEVTDPTDAGPIVELTAEGWAEQDGTPTPESPVPIQVARGRNLLDPEIAHYGTTPSTGAAGFTLVYEGDGWFHIYGTKSGSGNPTIWGATSGYSGPFSDLLPDEAADFYFLCETEGTPFVVGSAYTDSTHLVAYGSSASQNVRCGGFTDLAKTQALFGPISSIKYYIGSSVANGATVDGRFRLMICKGSTVHPYVPYGCVGVDVTHENTTTTIPIPLPSRGWVAALPDGTCDTLTLDGAGGFTWELATAEYTVTGNESIVGSADVGTCYRAQIQPLSGAAEAKSSTGIGLCSHSPYSVNWSSDSIHVYASGEQVIMFAEADDGAGTLAAFTGASVLYPLATPTTESGYVDMPIVPAHASISCPDLTDLAVRCCVDEGAAEIAGAWGRRLSDVTETLQSDLAEAVTDTVAARIEIATVSTNEAYDAQVINGAYPGRAIASIPELASEVSTAGSVYAFLHNRAGAANWAGLRIGDYLDVPVTGYGTIRYRLAGFDTYYDCGDTAMGHHFVCVPSAPIVMPASSDYTINGSYIYWNTTATNQGTEEETSPYLASNLHKWELEEYLLALPSALQGVLINHRSYVEVRYSASGNLNASTGWKWADLGKVWSPSEMEVYGCVVHGTPVHTQGLDSQFPIFRETKDRVKGGRVAWWLRVVSGSSASSVCNVSNYGTAYSGSTTRAWIRPLPCFLLG